MNNLTKITFVLLISVSIVFGVLIYKLDKKDKGQLQAIQIHSLFLNEASQGVYQQWLNQLTSTSTK